jgi:hypothetical protein
VSKYAAAQTLFPSAEKRREAREFIREKYGRSFSEQVQRYIMRDMKADREEALPLRPKRAKAQGE